MPKSGQIGHGGRAVDYYEIAVRQFRQQVLPPGLPPTTVWSYGSLAAPGAGAQGGSFHYPAFTIEATWNTPTRVKWINDLKNLEYLGVSATQAQEIACSRKKTTEAEIRSPTSGLLLVRNAYPSTRFERGTELQHSGVA